MSELNSYRIGNDTCPHCLAAHPITWDCRQSLIEPTRPQPSAEPVAYLYENKSGYREAVATRVIDGAWRTNGWTETPLYPASALEAARREALEEAAKVARNTMIAELSGLVMESQYRAGIKWCGQRIQETLLALKENPDAV